MKIFSSSTSIMIGAAALMALIAAGSAHADPRHGGPGHGHGPNGPRPTFSSSHHNHSNLYFSYSSGSSFYRPGWGPRPYYAYRPYPYYYPAYPVVNETVVYQTVPAAPLPQSSLPVYDDQVASDEEDGRYCREYQRPVTVGGVAQAGYGRACLQPDGSWEIVS